MVIELSTPALPVAGADIGFAEHVEDAEGNPTEMVIACTRGGIVVSIDLGVTWEFVAIPELSGVDLWNSFTMAEGGHLLQSKGAATFGPDSSSTSPTAVAGVAVLDHQWKLQNLVYPGNANWHGSRSIDEADGVIVFGEYPANAGRYAPGFDFNDPSAEQLARLHDSRLLRSVDGGHTWETVLQVDWRTIRHFHTVVADPWMTGRWWASSGDRLDENRVWESRDHGVSWTEISVELPTKILPPRLSGRARGVLRYTDLIVRDRDVLWGSDDLLGAGSAETAETPVARRGGARLFRTPKEIPWRPESIGYVGNPVRSLIDVGPAYVVTTEAKGVPGYSPMVFLLSKEEPFKLTPIMMVDNFGNDRPTGFTYSRASRRAKDGVFFTYRLRTDAFPTGAQILRWQVSVE